MTEPIVMTPPPVVGEEATEGKLVDLAFDNKTFGLRLLDTSEGRNQASMLINKMYAWRGYAGNHQLAADPTRVTLAARSKQGETIGTLTLGIDSDAGIMADQIFKDEIDVFRARGGKVCEFTKLAFDPELRSKEAMAALFHLTVMYARNIHNCTDLFIEVNPRHRRFYQAMLGFQEVGKPKINPRVNAPAHLLWVSFAFVTEQIRLLGGKGEAAAERSFYPLFFSEREERGIVQRLRDMQ